MAGGVSAVATPIIWNMITSNHIHAGEAVIDLIFSCYARNVTEANRIAVIVKYITGRLESIVVTVRAKRLSPLSVAGLLQLSNARELLRKGLDAETERRIQTGDVICTRTRHF
jgi:hypothetical protein